MKPKFSVEVRKGRRHEWWCIVSHADSLHDAEDIVARCVRAGRRARDLRIVSQWADDEIEKTNNHGGGTGGDAP
jgi:hypothetical protein